jgi:hypothetical protein
LADEQPLADLTEREVRLEVRKQPELGRAEGIARGLPLPTRGKESTKLRHLIDEGAEVRSMQQDVVDLTQEVTSGRMLASHHVHLGEL